MNDHAYIPFHRPSIGPDEFDAVHDVLASGWLTTGRVAVDFERQFAEYVGCKHALAVNSATAALQLALDAIGLSEGDEVLVPTYTFTASAEVATYFGGRPVLCDSVADGFNIDVQDAERRITSRTRAIIPVHLAGEPCDMDAVKEMASRHHLRVIEDAAHALPASWAGQRIGSTSDLTAFSFYATKTITTGEGGMLTTNNDEFAERAARMRLHGISSDAWKRYSKEGSWYYEVEHAGYKLNMPDLLAALGRAQLRKADRFMQRRSEIAARYDEAFNAVPELETPPQVRADAEHSWHLYILRLRPERLAISRAEFIEALKELGVGAAVHYIPLHLHPYYRRTYGYAPGDFRNAEDSYSRCLSLPIYPDLSDAEVERVIGAVVRVVGQSRVCAAGVA
jgi:dTDP-4-amino-4,6-dideoxygalactose transaminase